MKKKNEISHTDLIERVPSQLREFFGAIIKLNEKGIFHEPSCRLCSSEYRTGAEKVFLETPQYDANKYLATKTFLDSKGEELSLDIVKNHCNNHINQGENQLKKVEYISTIDNIASIKMSTIEEVDMMLAALKERLIETSKISGDSRMSRAEAEALKANLVTQMSKSFAALLKLRAELLGEMKKIGEVLVISKQKFKDIFDEALDKAKNDEERTVIVNLLKNLSGAEDKSSL